MNRLFACLCVFSLVSLALPRGLVRHYDFEETTVKSPVCRNLIGRDAPLRYSGKDGFKVVPGRRPELRAVRLDAGWFAGLPFAVENRSFTAEIWYRPIGQGKELGNGRTNGMIMAQGDGYWSGWRVGATYPEGALWFGIGRPKPSSAVSLNNDRTNPRDSVWHHLAVSWDGKQMYLHVDGRLLAKKAYTGDYSAPQGDRQMQPEFRVGFSYAGIGSLRMDVDEVRIYDRALTEAEIVAHALENPELAKGNAEFLAGINTCLAGDDLQGATRLATSGSLQSGLAEDVRGFRELIASDLLSRSGKNAESESFYRLACSRSGMQSGLLLEFAGDRKNFRKGVIDVRVPTAVVNMLSKDLEGEEALLARCTRALKLALEGGEQEAEKELRAVIASPAASPELWLEASFSLGRVQALVGNFSVAAETFAQLAESTKLSPTSRALARLASADCLERQGDRSASEAAFREVTDMGKIPEYLRAEAEMRIDSLRRAGGAMPNAEPGWGRIQLASLPRPGATFHVDVKKGKDENPGTEKQPFASLKRACEALRVLTEGGSVPRGGVTVYIHAGEYRVTESLDLVKAHSGSAAAPVVFRAWPGDEKPVLSGGVRLRKPQRVKDGGILARLPKQARRNVRVFDLKKNGLGEVGGFVPRGYGLSAKPTSTWLDLYENDVPLELSRWPAEGYIDTGEARVGGYKSASVKEPPVFSIAEDRPFTWKTEGADIWSWGFWARDWAGRRIGIEAFDRSTRTVRARHSTNYGVIKGKRHYYFNILEEIRKPGDWVLDQVGGKIYFWPKNRWAKYAIPLFKEPFFRLDGVEYVTFQDLVFELGQGMALTADNCRNLMFDRCIFRRFGGTAMSVDGYDNKIVGCDFHTLGGGGIRISGGERRTLKPGRNVVENNVVRDFSRVDRVYAPALLASGVGGRFAHNLFHDSPHHAIRLEGNDHVVEYNEIHSVVWEADDQSGIDMWGNAAYRGNVMRYNFWHHIGSGRSVAGQSGIRLDDAICGVLMYGNVFYRAADGRFGAIQIHGGKDNICDGNLMIDCRAAFSFSGWGEKGWKSKWDRSIRGMTERGGIAIGRTPYRDRYPELAHLHQVFDRNDILRNVVIDCARFSLRETGKNRYMLNLVRSSSENFMSVERRDFTIVPDSSLDRLRVGFPRIPFPSIGIYRGRHRASWPVENEVSPHFVRY